MRSGSLPVLIGLDEFQPAIPWQVAPQQSLPPLRRPRGILQNQTAPYNHFSANGDNPLNSVSHPKGAVQSAPVPPPSPPSIARPLEPSYASQRIPKSGPQPVPPNTAFVREGAGNRPKTALELARSFPIGMLASRVCPYCYNTGYSSPGTRYSY